MHKRLHKSSLSLALNYQIKDGRIYRLLAPSAAGIGVPLVPTEGRDEPRKTAKYGKPTQMASLSFFCRFYTALRQGSGTELQVKSMALHVKQKKKWQDVLYCNKFENIQKRRKNTVQKTTINYPLSIIRYFQFPTHCPELKNSI